MGVPQCKSSRVLASNLAEQTPQPSADHSIETKTLANDVAHILQLLVKNPGFGWGYCSMVHVGFRRRDLYQRRSGCLQSPENGAAPALSQMRDAASFTRACVYHLAALHMRPLTAVWPLLGATMSAGSSCCCVITLKITALALLVSLLVTAQSGWCLGVGDMLARKRAISHMRCMGVQACLQALPQVDRLWTSET